MATETKHLLTGYAAEILTADERRELLSAALDDQEVFDRLAEEETWRQILSQPGVRRELLAVLAAPGPAARFFAWLRRPAVTWAAASATAAVLAVVALRPTDPGGALDPSGGELPSVAVPPAPEQTPPGSEGPELTAKGLEGQRGFVAKGPEEGHLELAYTLELQEDDGFQAVGPGHDFRPGNRFRVRLAGNFNARVYLFNRARGEDAYGVLYPVTEEEAAPRSLMQGDVFLPTADEWLLEMDETPEDEELVLVVTTGPWAAFPSPGIEEIPAAALDRALAAAEGRLTEIAWRRSLVGEGVRLEATEPPEDLAFVLRILGERP